MVLQQGSRRSRETHRSSEFLHERSRTLSVVKEIFQSPFTTPSTSNTTADVVRRIVSWHKDRTDAVSAHTQKGVDFLERVGVYAKERAQIEEEYAAKLRTLAKKTIGKKKEDEEAIKTFTYVRAFANLLREVEAVAAQHEMISEKLRGEVVPFVGSKCGQHRASRKQCLMDLQSINQQLNAALDHLNKAQRNYGKSFKEAEAAFGKYYKAEKNMEISRLDLEKAKTNAQTRLHISEEAKGAYGQALQMVNMAQDTHYGQALPEALERMRKLDVERISDTRAAMELCIKSETDVRPIIARCHDDMRIAVEQMEPDRDTNMVVEQYKTGYMRPQPFQFEDLGSPDGTSGPPHSDVDSTLKRGMLGGKKDGKVSRKQSMHQKFFGGGDKNKSESNGDYGALPPQQRIRRLQAKIAELERERERSQQSRDGLVKMQQVYRDNPKLGKAEDCTAQLAQYEKEINAITDSIGKFRILLEDIQAINNLPVGSCDTPPSVRSGSSASSLPPSRKAPSSEGRTSVSEESITSSDGIRNGHDRKEEVYEECQMPALGTAKVQFAYDGGTEGTMRIKENDELLLIEKDEGDGWTRVRSLDGHQEGFVPSSYLKCSWYPAE